MAKIDAFFNLMFEQKASDLHLSSGNNPMLRVNGELHRVDHPPLDNDELKKMLYEIAPEYKIKVFEETGDVDFGITAFTAGLYNLAGKGTLPREVLSSFKEYDAINRALLILEELLAGTGVQTVPAGLFPERGKEIHDQRGPVGRRIHGMAIQRFLPTRPPIHRGDERRGRGRRARAARPARASRSPRAACSSRASRTIGE